MSFNLKQQAHQMIDHLPDTATWDDVVEKARFHKAVGEGIAAENRGDFASDEEVRASFAEWGVKA